MAILTSIIGRSVELLLMPFQQLSPLVGLAVVSLMTAVVMLLVVKAVSNQRQIAEVKRAMAASLFEIRLFNDDLSAIFRAQADMLRHNARYLRLSLMPMLWLMVPVALIVTQLEFHYGYGAVVPGNPILVTAQLRETASGETGTTPVASLDAPAQVRVLTPPLWFPQTNEMIWRVAPAAAGHYELRARVGEESVTKTLDVGEGVVRRSPVRLAGGFLNRLQYPAEPPIADGAAITAISISYPSHAIVILGRELPWLLVYFALSIVFAMLLRRPFGVTL